MRRLPLFAYTVLGFALALPMALQSADEKKPEPIKPLAPDLRVLPDAQPPPFAPPKPNAPPTAPLTPTLPAPGAPNATPELPATGLGPATSIRPQGPFEQLPTATGFDDGGA